RQALAARSGEHGASVHYVTAELDGGPVIAQARVPVHADDDEETLAARVLAREHPLLVETLRWIAAGRIVLDEHGVHVDQGAMTAPRQLASNNRFAGWPLNEARPPRQSERRPVRRRLSGCGAGAVRGQLRSLVPRQAGGYRDDAGAARRRYVE